MHNAIGAHIYAGGFTVGVKKHFNVLAHLEHAAYGEEVVRLNYPDLPVIAGGPESWKPFLESLPKGRNRPRFIFANPPCAIWSGASAGRATAWHEDPRLQFHHDIFDLLGEVEPDVMAIESVPPIFTKGRAHVDDLIEKAKVLGYSTTVVKHNAMWMGVAQKRGRIFLAFHRIGIDWSPPNFEKTVTVRAVIKGLPKRTKGYDPTIRSEKFLHLLKHTPPGGRIRTTFDEFNPDQVKNDRGDVIGRPSFLDTRFPWDKPGPIVLAGKAIHPDQPRYFTQEELAAICSFPSDYKWPAKNFNEISGYMSRGVMPRVGEWLAENVSRAIDVGKRKNEQTAMVYDVTGPPGTEYELPAANPVTYHDIKSSSGGAEQLDLPWGEAPEREPTGEGKKMEYGDALPKGFDIPKGLLFLTKGDFEKNPFAEVILRPGDRVMDVGACVGAFSAAALEQGAGAVRAYEPMPKTFAILAKNAARYGDKMVTTEAALITGREPTITISARPIGLSSTLPRPEDKTVTVNALSFYTELTSFKPHVLKLDIEGGEYALLDGLRPGDLASVRSLFVEFHPIEDREGRVERIRAFLESEGFTVVNDRLRAFTLIRGATVSATAKPAAPVRVLPKALLTGSTPMQVGSERTQLKIITAAASWKAALEDLGYEVEWRAVTPGEDMSSYATVISILNKPNSIASNYFYGALWALTKRADAIIALDDWQISETLSGIQTFARSRERAFRLRGDGISEEYRARLFGGVLELADGNWRWPVIFPILGNGDISLLGTPARNVVAIDPTAYAARYPKVEARRTKRWVQASLLGKPVPTGLTWPIDEYGPQNRGEGGIGPAGANAKPRLEEEALMAVYGASWGVLSPAHYHAGSGWWRVRYLMAADAGAILSADPREAAALGDPYVAASDPHRVEKLSLAGLADLASAQAARLREIVWPKERVKKALKDLIASRASLAPLSAPQTSPSAPVGEARRPVPAPAAIPGRSKPVAAPRPVSGAPRKPGSGARIREMLLAGRGTPDILATIHAEFPGSKAGPSDVSWNKQKLRNDAKTAGLPPPL